jgi:hypothetical protein
MGLGALRGEARAGERCAASASGSVKQSTLVTRELGGAACTRELGCVGGVQLGALVDGQAGRRPQALVWCAALSLKCWAWALLRPAPNRPTPRADAEVWKISEFSFF